MGSAALSASAHSDKYQIVGRLPLLLGVGFVGIGAWMLAKTWDLPTNEMNRGRNWHTHRNARYLKWIGLGLIVTGIIVILAAFDLSSFS